MLIIANVPDAVLEKSWRCGDAGQLLAIQTGLTSWEHFYD